MINRIVNKILRPYRLKRLQKEGEFIFSVNTGRSGSDYLAELLKTSDEVLAFHERQPYLNGSHLEIVSQKPLLESEKDREVKVGVILNELNQSGKKVYAETNHMFAKTFYDIAFKNFENITVIHLNRNIRDTAKSFLKLRYFTDENKFWPLWMIHPNSPNCLLKFPSLENEYELIFANLAEMRCRSKYIQKNYKANHVIIDLYELNDANVVEKMFKNIGISFSDKTSKLIGLKVNQRDERKEDFTFDFSQDCFDKAYDKINEIYALDD